MKREEGAPLSLLLGSPPQRLEHVRFRRSFFGGFISIKLCRVLYNLAHRLMIARLKDMPSLYLKCKTCGVKFESGIVMEKRGLEVIKLVDNQHTCPNGHIHTYSKKDYFY